MMLRVMQASVVQKLPFQALVLSQSLAAFVMSSLYSLPSSEAPLAEFLTDLCSTHTQLDVDFSLGELEDAIHKTRKTTFGFCLVTYQDLSNLCSTARPALLNMFKYFWRSRALPAS